MRFQVVFLSIPSGPKLCLKDREWHNSFGTSNGQGDSLQQRYLGVRSSKTRRTLPITINNHLLARIGVTVMCPISL